MIEVLKLKKRIINFDESMVDSSTSRMRSWSAKLTCSARWYKILSQKVSILLAVSSDGIIIFQFLDGNNNEASVSSFLVQLASKYD